MWSARTWRWISTRDSSGGPQAQLSHRPTRTARTPAQAVGARGRKCAVHLHCTCGLPALCERSAAHVCRCKYRMICLANHMPAAEGVAARLCLRHRCRRTVAAQTLQVHGAHPGPAARPYPAQIMRGLRQLLASMILSCEDIPKIAFSSRNYILGPSAR